MKSVLFQTEKLLQFMLDVIRLINYFNYKTSSPFVVLTVNFVSRILCFTSENFGKQADFVRKRNVSAIC